MTSENWTTICPLTDLIINDGVCALVDDEQVAVFRTGNGNEVYAISNYDPIGKASVLSRGIVGDIDGKFVVASPLYKQHFDLQTGICLEDEEGHVDPYEARITAEGIVEVRKAIIME